MTSQEAQLILGVDKNAPWGDVVKVRGDSCWDLAVLSCQVVEEGPLDVLPDVFLAKYDVVGEVADGDGCQDSSPCLPRYMFANNATHTALLSGSSTCST